MQRRYSSDENEYDQRVQNEQEAAKDGGGGH